VTALERHCRWLLQAYPAWYRRERAGEMLGTLLESSPPGRSWPSVRDAGALAIGGLRVRGWTWLLSMLWVVIGAGGAIYVAVAFSHPGYGEGLLIPPNIQWPSEPQLIIDVGVIAEVVWLLLSGPLLVAGFVRLRGWRSRNWLRAAGWAGSLVAGWALMIQAGEWAAAGVDGTNGVLRVGEIAICAAWLILGAIMTWILAAPAPSRARCVPDKTVTGA
jgi:hypothetical protein